MYFYYSVFTENKYRDWRDGQLEDSDATQEEAVEHVKLGLSKYLISNSLNLIEVR